MMEVQESRDRQTAQLKPPVSDSQMREWETKASAWLSTLPKRRYVNTDEMDSWIELNQTFIPEDLKTMPRSQLYGRILSIHKRIRRPNPENDISQPELSVPRFPSLQENDISQLELDISQPELSEPLFPSLQENDISQPELSQPRFPSLQEIDISQPDLSQPRFQRTDQWKPVYSWLESLDRNEVLKAREIDDWLSENPAIKDQLYSRHSRNHLIHYVQRCHLKMLRRRDKLKKKGSKPFTTRTPTKVHNNAVSTVSVPLPCNFSSNLVKVNEISLAKKNEAFLRYELFTELKDQLTSLLSKPKHVINLKESGSPSLLRQKSAEATNHDGLSVASNEERNIRVMSGNVSHTQNAESFPSSGKSRLRSPLDSKSGRKS